MITQSQERINLRTSSERKSYIAKAASYCGTTLSAFMLESAEQRAKEVMQEQTQIQLTVKDWNAFTHILDEAENKLRPNLKALIKEHVNECV